MEAPAPAHQAAQESDPKPLGADAPPAPQKGKAPPRFWQVTDQNGEPVNSNRKSRLQGASPYQAVLKAVTRFATDDGVHTMFYLREVGRHKAAGKAQHVPPRTQVVRLHKYEGWKEELLSHEQSPFTSTKKIGRKPRAKSHGVDVLYIKKYDAPLPATPAPAASE